MIVILPFGAWIIHNVLVTEEALGERRAAYHPIGLQQLRNLLGYITQWFAPELVPRYLRFFVLHIRTNGVGFRRRGARTRSRVMFAVCLTMRCYIRMILPSFTMRRAATP
jgi:hypothetical protein